MSKHSKQNEKFEVLDSSEISPNLKPSDGFLFAARDEADKSVWLYKAEPRMMDDGRWILDGDQDIEDEAFWLRFDVPAIESRRLYYLGFS